MAYSFADAKVESRHKTQYFEIMGNRAIYHDGWFAGVIHKAPWEAQPRAKLLEDKWELYDTRKDFSLAQNLAAKNPQKLKEMQELFTQEAIKNRVLPIDDRSIERLNAKLAGRPDLMDGRTSLTVYPGMKGMSENAFINIKNTSHTITAELDIPKKGAKGVILAQGGRFGGWSLYLDKSGKPIYAYNFLGLKRYSIVAAKTLPPGKATLRFEFAYDGGGLGKGGTGKLFVNNQPVGQGRIELTQPMVFSTDDAADVGEDDGSPVTEDYKVSDSQFTGTIQNVTVALQSAKAQSADEEAKSNASFKKAMSD